MIQSYVTGGICFLITHQRETRSTQGKEWKFYVIDKYDVLDNYVG